LTASIEVAPAGANRFAVTVQSAGATTVHQVVIPPRLLEDLDLGTDDGSRLVYTSFEFLLEREPASSILRSFDLDVIGRYFPEYAATMRRRMASGGS
jgi:hypothetical protein